jgi:hypothetical protein
VARERSVLSSGVHRGFLRLAVVIAMTGGAKARLATAPGSACRAPTISPPSIGPSITIHQMLLLRRVAQWSKPPSKPQNAKMRIAESATLPCPVIKAPHGNHRCAAFEMREQMSIESSRILRPKSVLHPSSPTSAKRSHACPKASAKHWLARPRRVAEIKNVSSEITRVGIISAPWRQNWLASLFTGLRLVVITRKQTSVPHQRRGRQQNSMASLRAGSSPTFRSS